MKIIALLFMMLMTSVSHAQEPRAADAVRMVHRFDDLLNGATNFLAPVQPGCFYCTTDAGEATTPKTCTDAYQNLFDKPKLDFRIAIGYTDGFLHAEDGPMRAAWIEHLLKPCPENGVGSCGFKRDPDDISAFSKMVSGPDGKDHEVTVHIVNSAAGIDDLDNRAGARERQAAQTKAAEANFFDGLASADLVIYFGHARKGGGPSFAPPERLSNGISVNYGAYKNRTSEKRMLEVLTNNSHPPKLIGLFACEGNAHFAQDVKAATRGKTGIVTSNGLTQPAVGLSEAYAMLDSVLATRCKKEFVAAMNSVTTFENQTDQPPTLDGFFADEPAGIRDEDALTSDHFRPAAVRGAVIRPAANSVAPQNRQKKSQGAAGSAE